jgi:hypothetical protein
MCGLTCTRLIVVSRILAVSSFDVTRFLTLIGQQSQSVGRTADAATTMNSNIRFYESALRQEIRG